MQWLKHAASFKNETVLMECFVVVGLGLQSHNWKIRLQRPLLYDCSASSLVRANFYTLPNWSQHRVQLQKYPPIEAANCIFYYSNTFCNSALWTHAPVIHACLGWIISVATHYNFQRIGSQMRYAYPRTYIHLSRSPIWTLGAVLYA